MRAQVQAALELRDKHLSDVSLMLSRKEAEMGSVHRDLQDTLLRLRAENAARRQMESRMWDLRERLAAADNDAQVAADKAEAAVVAHGEAVVGAAAAAAAAAATAEEPPVPPPAAGDGAGSPAAGASAGDHAGDHAGVGGGAAAARVPSPSLSDATRRRDASPEGARPASAARAGSPQSLSGASPAASDGFVPRARPRPKLPSVKSNPTLSARAHAHDPVGSMYTPAPGDIRAPPGGGPETGAGGGTHHHDSPVRAGEGGEAVASAREVVDAAAARGVDALLDVMRAHGGSPSVQWRACAAIKSAAAGGEEARLRLTVCGAVGLVLRAMAAYPSVANIASYGCRALTNLAYNSGAWGNVM